MDNCQKTILIVDDMPVNRAILSKIFSNEYLLLEADNGKDALNIIEKEQQKIDIVLLDIYMPILDGFDVMERLKETGRLEHLPVIFITAEDSISMMRKAYELGVTDVITKPFYPDIVRRRVKNVLGLYTKQENLEAIVARQTASLRKQSLLLAEAMSSIIEFKNMESGQHILRIRIITQYLLETLMQEGYPVNLTSSEIQLISEAAVMHDIGKITIPDAILNKPARLTPEEFEVIKRHTIEGCEVAKKLKFVRSSEYMNYCFDICRHHHERWDGNGYPDGLKGDEITIWSQVVSIADVYDALTNERVYKKAISHEKALSMIKNGECGVFNPKLLDCFIRNADHMLEYIENRIQNEEEMLRSE